MQVTKKFTVLISATILLSFLAGYYASPIIKQHKNPKVSVNVFVFHESLDGKTVLASGNLITDIGEAYIRNSISGGEGQNVTKYISLSNDASPAAAWTKLPNELAASGFTRALGTVVNWTYSGDYAFNVTKKFTATGSVTAQCAGLNWSPTASSDNNLFAAAAFTQTAFSSGDNCTIVWMIVFNAN